MFIRWSRGLSVEDQNKPKVFRLEFFYNCAKAIDVSMGKDIVKVFEWALTDREKSMIKLPVYEDEERVAESTYQSVGEVQKLEGDGRGAIDGMTQWYLNWSRIDFYDRYHGIPEAPPLFDKTCPDHFKPYRKSAEAIAKELRWAAEDAEFSDEDDW